MDEDAVRRTAYAMPLNNPSYPAGPYRFINRECMVITYRSDIDALKRVVPEPLVPIQPLVNYEFIRMPDSTGFGDYTESGQVVPVRLRDEVGGYVHLMFLKDHPPVAVGRELWGFPKKLANPSLKVDRDTLVGTLDCGRIRIATGAMGFKHRELDQAIVMRSLGEPGFLPKVVPHVDGSARICELVRYRLRDILFKGSWTGPGALELHPDALAPVANLPVREVIADTMIYRQVNSFRADIGA